MSEPASVLNFGAGPAKIPQQVLQRAKEGLLDFNGCGMSVMELSHRSKEFETILENAKSKLRSLLSIPDNYTILFMQGGATTQFSAIFYNLVAAKQERMKKEGQTGPVAVDYIVTGDWSSKAAEEAERLCETNGLRVNRVVNTKANKYTSIPPQSEWKFSPAEEAAYVYYCDNETVRGVEFPSIPEVDPSVPLVADVSSNFLSRPMDVSKFGVIYGGAQKNLGPAGVSIIIVRKDLLESDLLASPRRPIMLDYKTMDANNSLYNTPPTFAIYMVGLMLEWLVDQGGLDAIQKANAEKANQLYQVIDESAIFTCPVDASVRSTMNVVFTVVKGPDEASQKQCEKRFLEGAEKKRMVQLKGHRSVGGIRASIYNAMAVDDVKQLISYMKEFEQEEQQRHT